MDRLLDGLKETRWSWAGFLGGGSGVSPSQALRIAVAWIVFRSRYGSAKINWQAASKLAIFPEIGVAYNRIKKNANTTTVIMLREMETGDVDPPCLAKDRSANLKTARLADIWGLREKFIFVVVRNPYSRVLSAFLEKFRSEKYRKRYGQFDLTPEGFSSFIRRLEVHGLEEDGHWDLQAKQILLPLSHYDAVVEFESFEHEMAAMLAKQGLTPPDGRLNTLYPLDVEAGKKTSANERMREFYYQDDVIRTVRRLYAADFEFLGYSPDFPGYR